MAITRQHNDATYDYALTLKDASTAGEASTAAWQVSSANKIIDMGASARFEGRVIVDVSACEVDSSNETYLLIIQGSTSSTFGSGVWNLGCLPLGDSSVSYETVDTVAGRREIHICNEVNGTVYRYLRGYSVVGGTIGSGGIVFTARLVKKA